MVSLQCGCTAVFVVTNLSNYTLSQLYAVSKVVSNSILYASTISQRSHCHMRLCAQYVASMSPRCCCCCICRRVSVNHTRLPGKAIFSSSFIFVHLLLWNGKTVVGLKQKHNKKKNKNMHTYKCAYRRICATRVCIYNIYTLSVRISVCMYVHASHTLCNRLAV